MDGVELPMLMLSEIDVDVTGELLLLLLTSTVVEVGTEIGELLVGVTGDSDVGEVRRVESSETLESVVMPGVLVLPRVVEPDD